MPPLVRRLPFACCLVLAPALAFAGAAAAGNGGTGPVTPRSPNAEAISTTYWLIMAFALAIFVIVEVTLVIFVVRYRRGRRAREEEGPQVVGHTRLELIWTVLPVLVLVVIAGFVFYKLPDIKNVPSAAASNRLEVEVQGRQFYWEFLYPDGQIAIDKLRAPAGRTVVLNVTAPTWDVIHSWWVPALGGKFDAIPGETNRTWFRVDRPGTYPGQCAEFCGLEHALMLASVQVVPPDKFESWLGQADQALGKETWDGVCAKCHGLGGQGGVGPAIKGSPILANRDQLQQLLETGRGKMPPVGRGWPTKQLDALISYLRSSGLGGAQSGG
jgi:cytochrome c oxidase subunit II